MPTKGPGESPLLFLDVVKILDKFDVAYAVVGAFAAAFYGAIRASIDVDAIISLQNISSNMNQLIDALKDKKYHVKLRMGDQDDPVGAVINVEDGLGNKVDLLMNIKVIHEDVFNRSVKTKFMGTQIMIVGLEDFIAMKIFAGSAKDIDDIKNVLSADNSLNIKFLKSLVAKQGERAQKQLDKLLK